ncbi:MAG: hypothetical protein LKI27_06035 [Actinomyces sp.]|nr:hypothetical protein [Actinomyces sp.]MCI1662441.1 hypothetical protein [Actinomyces sp.]
MNTTPNAGAPRQHDTSGGNATSVPASALTEVGKALPAATVLDPAGEVLHMMATAPAGLERPIARLGFLSYLVGRVSMLEDIQCGRPDGLSDYAAGYSDAEADMAALQRWAVANARASISGPDFAALCDLRGEPDRAEAQRAILRERRIA